jgi:hypothetical protein
LKQEFVKTSEGALLPVGEPVKSYERLGAGETIVLDVKRQRNPKFHRLAMSWLMSVFENQDHFQTFDQMRYTLTCMAGYIKHQEVRGNKVIVIPKSINFESMDDDEFNQWQQDIDTVLREKYGINVMIGQH